MDFDAKFSMGQGSHFASRLCHKTIVFRSAFFDAGFVSSGAMRVEVSGDGQEHFIYHS